MEQTINVSVRTNGTPAAQYKTVILKPNVIDGVNTLTQTMMSQPNTKYVIKYDYTLAEDITVPANCVLEFDGGSIANNNTSYALNGVFDIIAPSVQILNNVEVPDYKGILKFSWVVGDRTTLSNTDFKKLINGEIDFENIQYTTNEDITLHEYDNITLKNFKVNLGGSLLKYFLTPQGVYTGTCKSYKTNNQYLETTIETSVNLPSDYLGYIIEIQTADAVKLDNRPNDDGVPTLWKGITSVITKINGNKVTIGDYIDSFSETNTYNDHVVMSKFTIYKPSSINLINSDFHILNKKDSVSFSAYNFIVTNCKFTTEEGSVANLLASGHTGLIENCVIQDAQTGGEDPCYGIQVNSGTNIIIDNCLFSNNRRSVDFSGTVESRYCEVRNCTVYNDTIPANYGSALGGHSTSYGNKFINNTIFGYYQIGIQLRGENEIVKGNVFKCRTQSCAVYASINTIISNNIVDDKFTYGNPLFVSLYADVPNNKLIIKENVIRVNIGVVDIQTSGVDIHIISNDINISATNYPNTGFIVSKATPVKYIGNIYTYNYLSYSKPKFFNDGGTIDFQNSIIDGWRINGNITDVNGNAFASGVTSVACNVFLDTKQIIDNSIGMYDGIIKLAIYLNLSETLSSAIKVKLDNDIILGANGFLRKYTKLLFSQKDNADANIVVSLGNDAQYKRTIQIGLATESAPLTAGVYYIEALL